MTMLSSDDLTLALRSLPTIFSQVFAQQLKRAFSCAELGSTSE